MANDKREFVPRDQIFSFAVKPHEGDTEGAIKSVLINGVSV